MLRTGIERLWWKTIGMGVASALLISGCGSDAPEDADDDVDAAAEDTAEDEVYDLEMRLSPSNVAFAIAQDKGLFDGINLEYSPVGYDESISLFVAGDSPVGQESAWEAARLRSEGEDIVFFGLPSALSFYSGLIVRAEDADTYQSLSDLEGKKVGHPGFGTGTWAAFEIIAKSLYGMDARTDFEPVEGGPGALLGLLETGEIDATINFTGQTATALTRPDDFKILLNFTEEWERDHGQPLTITGLMARGPWLEENTDVARRLVEGADRGLQWMKDNTDAFRPGGEYADFVAGEGWLADDETNEKIIELLLAGEYYLSADTYSQEWIDSMYEFIQQGEGVLADEIPPKEEIFFPPERLLAD